MSRDYPQQYLFVFYDKEGYTTKDDEVIFLESNAEAINRAKLHLLEDNDDTISITIFLEGGDILKCVNKDVNL